MRADLECMVLAAEHQINDDRVVQQTDAGDWVRNQINLALKVDRCERRFSYWISVQARAQLGDLLPDEEAEELELIRQVGVCPSWNLGDTLTQCRQIDNQSPQVLDRQRTGLTLDKVAQVLIICSRTVSFAVIVFLSSRS